MVGSHGRCHRRSEGIAICAYAQETIFRVEEKGPVLVDEIVEPALDGPAALTRDAEIVSGGHVRRARL